MWATHGLRTESGITPLDFKSADEELPPSTGWWASTNMKDSYSVWQGCRRKHIAFRWFNKDTGFWSDLYFEEGVLPDELKKYIPRTEADLEPSSRRPIVWCDYWPANARVPRI